MSNVPAALSKNAAGYSCCAAACLNSRPSISAV